MYEELNRLYPALFSLLACNFSHEASEPLGSDLGGYFMSDEAPAKKALKLEIPAVLVRGHARDVLQSDPYFLFDNQRFKVESVSDAEDFIIGHIWHFYWPHENPRAGLA